ncbi:hypothetical protein LEMLEM_LOCUS2490, partial [Lemmus lemmus]
MEYHPRFIFPAILEMNLHQAMDGDRDRAHIGLSSQGSDEEQK